VSTALLLYKTTPTARNLGRSSGVIIMDTLFVHFLLLVAVERVNGEPMASVWLYWECFIQKVALAYDEGREFYQILSILKYD
jgi:hypothetical protein